VTWFGGTYAGNSWGIGAAGADPSSRA